MGERNRNEKGQFSAEESAGGQSVQTTPEKCESNTLTSGQLDAPQPSGGNSSTGLLSTETGENQSRKTGSGQEKSEVLAALEKSEAYIFLQCLMEKGIISEEHAQYLLHEYPVDTRADFSLLTTIELACPYPEGLWKSGGTPGPLKRKYAALFLKAVIEYLHYSKHDVAEDVRDPDDAMRTQVLLLPTGRAILESPALTLQDVFDQKVAKEVGKTNCSSHSGKCSGQCVCECPGTGESSEKNGRIHAKFSN